MSSSVLDYAVLKALASAGEATDEQLAAELGHELRAVEMSLVRLKRRDLVGASVNFGLGYGCYEPTREGYAVAHSGAATLGEALGKLSAPNKTVTHNLRIGNNYGNASQGDYNHLSQTSIDPAALDGLLEVMRSHGDDLTAAELERLERSGDKPGFWKKLGERFSGKAVDAAAGRTVDYAADALPWLVMLFGGALGIPVG